MFITIWKQMGWSAVAKRPGWVLYMLESRGKAWRVTGADLYTEDRVYVGHWHLINISRSQIVPIEKQALKMHGRPDWRTEESEDQIPPIRRTR